MALGDFYFLSSGNREGRKQDNPTFNGFLSAGSATDAPCCSPLAVSPLQCDTMWVLHHRK